MPSTLRSESFQIKRVSGQREWRRPPPLPLITADCPQGAGVSEPRRTVTSAPAASG